MNTVAKIYRTFEKSKQSQFISVPVYYFGMPNNSIWFSTVVRHPAFTLDGYYILHLGFIIDFGYDHKYSYRSNRISFSEPPKGLFACDYEEWIVKSAFESDFLRYKESAGYAVKVRTLPSLSDTARIIEIAYKKYCNPVNVAERIAKEKRLEQLKKEISQIQKGREIFHFDTKALV